MGTGGTLHTKRRLPEITRQFVARLTSVCSNSKTGGNIMKTKGMAIILAITFLTGSYGCGTIPEQHKGAATGGAVGAVAGAAVGAAVSDSKVQGAIIGGLIGGLVGGAIGHYAYDKKKTRDETAQTYGYEPKKGGMIRIEEVFTQPKAVLPGNEVKLGATYALLDPDPNAKISVTEIREILYQNELVGKPETTVSHIGGTYSTNVPLYLPANAKKGTYRVITTVKTAVAQDSKEMTFQVN